MNVTIMSRQAIAKLADDAAATWTRNPEAKKPVNPFDALEQPDHHDAWEREFTKAHAVCQAASFFARRSDAALGQYLNQTKVSV